MTWCHQTLVFVIAHVAISTEAFLALTSVRAHQVVADGVLVTHAQALHFALVDVNAFAVLHLESHLAHAAVLLAARVHHAHVVFPTVRNCPFGFSACSLLNRHALVAIAEESFFAFASVGSLLVDARGVDAAASAVRLGAFVDIDTVALVLLPESHRTEASIASDVVVASGSGIALVQADGAFVNIFTLLQRRGALKSGIASARACAPLAVGVVATLVAAGALGRVAAAWCGDRRSRKCC